jgi:hypothetical protein
MINFSHQKDPVADAVLGVMKGNQLHRDVERALNEALQIENIRALPVEDRETFKAALEASYQLSLKEGAVTLDEISKKLATKYVKKVAASHPDEDKVKDRMHGLKLAQKNLTRNEGAEELNEISKKLATRYVNKVAASHPDDEKVKDRMHGLKLARKNLTRNEETEEVNEVSKGVLSRYMDKAVPDMEKQRDKAYTKKWTARKNKADPDAARKMNNRASGIALAFKKKETAPEEVAHEKKEAPAKEMLKKHRRRRRHKRAVRKEETTFDSVMEEVRHNINERAVWAINNDKINEFLASLNESQMEFLEEGVANTISDYIVENAQVDEASGFGSAFAAARAKFGAGKTFTYGGKSYSTNRADDRKMSATAARPSSRPTPTAPTRSTSIADRSSSFAARGLSKNPDSSQNFSKGDNAPMSVPSQSLGNKLSTTARSITGPVKRDTPDQASVSQMSGRLIPQKDAGLSSPAVPQSKAPAGGTPAAGMSRNPDPTQNFSKGDNAPITPPDTSAADKAASMAKLSAAGSKIASTVSGAVSTAKAAVGLRESALEAAGFEDAKPKTKSGVKPVTYKIV